MTLEEQRKELIEAAKKIKDFCNNSACGDCPFYCNQCGKFPYPCEFWNNVPWHWNLLEGEDCNENEQRRID